jgi:hypothetical protein
MASTRISNDYYRKQTDNIQSTGVGRYVLDVPGNGLNNPYINDINILPQQWGGNLMNDSINIENKLWNVGSKLTNSYLVNNRKYLLNQNINKKIYPIDNSKKNDSTLISNPAWLLKDEYRDINDIGLTQHIPVFNDNDIRSQQISTRNIELNRRN